MAYTKEFEVHIHQVDQKRICPPAEILRMMHITTDCQMHAEQCTIEDVQSQGMAMVLSKLVLCFYAPVRQADILSVTTWPCPSGKFRMERCYQAKVGDKIIAEGISTWALIDIRTHHLLRTDKVDFSHYTFGEKLTLDPAIADFEGEYEPAAIHRVAYSDVDTYLHMNNTRYIDMICDLVPDMAERTPCALTIHFTNEAPMGSLIEISRGEANNTCYFRSVVNENPNIEAAIRFSELKKDR